MADTAGQAHPYIPNSAPDVRRRMLSEVGVDDAEELYREIPEHLRFRETLDIPTPLRSEYELRRHVEGLLAKNSDCRANLNFLGAGCWQHYVPAVCDEVNGRGEFLTAYGGHWYSDHGKHQAYFEYQSMMGELLDLDAVSLLTYDWSSAASSAVLMATRITGRPRVLVPSVMSPERRSQLHNFTRSAATIEPVTIDLRTGRLDLDDLRAKLADDVACVYVENPSYLGALETGIRQIEAAAHRAGALLVTGVDPISLGVLEAPGAYGADIACGQIQPLGIHMSYGGGVGGFLASQDDPHFKVEFPTLLTSVMQTVDERTLGFAWANWEETSWVKRERARDFTGTTTNLYSITAGVYLALMGPQGMREVGESIMGNAQYAAHRLADVPGIRLPLNDAPFFKEFVVNIDGTGRTVVELAAALREHGVFAGKDLSAELPELGQSALWCVTEVHTKEDLDRMVGAVAEVLR